MLLVLSKEKISFRVLKIFPSVFTMESCNRYSGVEHAAYLHYVRNASVYFGPGCNNGVFLVLLRWCF